MNALKHAGPCEIRLLLSSTDGLIQLQVQDTGRGFDPAALDGENHAQHGGFGLFNIRERLGPYGGELAIGASSTGGARVTIILPVTDGEE